MIKKRCENCKKILKLGQEKYCSNKCKYKYFKKYKISAFYNKEIQSKGGRNAAILYPKLAKRRGRMGGKITAKLHPTLAKRRGNITAKLYPKLFSKMGKIGGKLSQKTLKKYKLSNWYNPELNRKVRENISKNRRNLYYFKRIFFDSRCELEIAYNLYYQYNLKLENRKTVHVLIDIKEFDFFIEKLKLFIEYHDWDPKYKSDLIKYYKDRRNILDVNDYNNYKLLVIK